MVKKFVPVLLMWVLICSSVLLLLAACESKRIPLHSDFSVGMSKPTLIARFGPPDQKQTMYKRSDAVWGPIEDFWHNVPPNAKIEIWSYKSLSALEAGNPRLTEGNTELYFIEDTYTVDGIGFAPAGVVYEAGS